MKKRGSRPTRFSVIRGLYSNYQAGLLTSEAVKNNINALGFVIYESELEKFAAEFPDINMAEFVEFIKAHNAHKVAGHKATGATKQYQLITREKALQVGVAEEDVDEYVRLMGIGKQWQAQIQSIVKTGTVTISIPIRQPKEKEVTA